MIIVYIMQRLDGEEQCKYPILVQFTIYAITIALSQANKADLCGVNL